MPTTYEVADPEVNEFVQRVMHRYHRGLADMESTVDILMASPPVDEAGDPTGPALKHHGVKALATIRQTRPDERALGQADIHLKIDLPFWEENDEETRTALIDHELEHLKPKLKDGAAQRDAYNRPLFVVNPHSWEVGWFFNVARRHGQKSVECRQLQDLLNSDHYRDCMQASVQVPPVTRRRMGGPNPATGDI